MGGGGLSKVVLERRRGWVCESSAVVLRVNEYKVKEKIVREG